MGTSASFSAVTGVVTRTSTSAGTRSELFPLLAPVPVLDQVLATHDQSEMYLG